MYLITSVYNHLRRRDETRIIATKLQNEIDQIPFEYVIIFHILKRPFSLSIQDNRYLK